MRVVSVDFDGVLHRAGKELEMVAHFEWLPVLESLLEPHPDVQVMVHSTWRYSHTEKEVGELLGALRPRFIGCAPRGPRAESIVWFLRMNRTIESVLVLDDAPGEFPADFSEQLVVCPPERGVSDPEVQAAIQRWLNASKGIA